MKNIRIILIYLQKYSLFLQDNVDNHIVLQIYALICNY